MPQLSVRDLAARLGTAWSGDPDAAVSGVATLAEAGPGDLSFWADPRYREAALKSRAGVILVGVETATLSPERTLLVREPHLALWQVLTWLYPEAEVVPGCHPTAEIAPTAHVDPSACIEAHASVGEDAHVGPRAHLGPGVRVGKGVVVGEDARIGPNAVLLDGVRIGARVRVGPGSVIGSVGFGYVRVDGMSRRVPHVGTVVIEDDVELGANCTVDRATLGSTRIGRGSKLDNLVHVGHNVTIGAHVLIAAQCGLSGSATLGDGVQMGGQAGVAGHIVVAPGSRIAAKAGVMKSVSGTVAGHPARPLARQRRAEAALQRLDDLRRRVRELERIVAANPGPADSGSARTACDHDTGVAG